MASQNHDSDASVNHDKPWQRPWSTDEVHQNAPNWNLAGDSGLLRHLQEFSQNILTRAHSTGKALDSLIEDVNSTSTEINNVNNRFLCLANTQFVENRVYEDDDREIPQDIPILDEKSKEETEAVVLKKVKEALSMSVAVLDTMFEPVEIQASDSDEETENDKVRTKTLLLEPHNPYLNRPLPCLIGSDAFMSDDKIGLGDSPSDGEEKLFGVDVDQDVELSSESEIDLVLPDGKRDRDAYSSISSASGSFVDSGIQSQQAKKVKSSIPEHSSSSSEMHHPEVQQHTSNSLDPNTTFAEQLAAKLGNMTNTAEHLIVESITPGKSHSDDLFGGPQSDDEEDDTLFKGSSGLFSNRPKRFDDLEDANNMFRQTDSDPKNSNSKNGTHQQTVPIFIEKNQHLATNDLFGHGNDDDDDDDIFSFKRNKNERKDLTTATKSLFGGTSNNEPLGRNASSVSDFNPGSVTSTPQNKHENVSFRGPADVSVSSNKVPNHDVKNVNTMSSTSSEERTVSSLEKKPAGGVLLPGLKDKLPRRPPSVLSSSASESEPLNNSVTPSQSLGDEQLNSNLQSGFGGTSSSGVVDSMGENSSSFLFTSPAMSSTRKQMPTDDGYQTRNSLPSQADHTGSNVPDLFQDNSVFVPQSSSSISKGLFGDIEDNEDDLFADNTPCFKSSSSHSEHVSSSIFSRNEDFGDLFSDVKDNVSNRKQTPTTDTATIQGSGRSQSKSKHDSAPFSESSDSLAQPNNFLSNVSKQAGLPANVHKTDIFSSVPPPFKSEARGKAVSLFDDSDSGEDDLLFSSASSAGSRRSQASADLLSTSAVSTIEKKPLSKKSLFDDDDALFGSIEDDPDVDIFSSSTRAKVKPTSIEKPQSIPKENVMSTSASGNSEVESRSLHKSDSSISRKDVSDDLFTVKNELNVGLLANVGVTPDISEHTIKPVQTPFTNSNEDDLFSDIGNAYHQNDLKLSKSPKEDFSSQQDELARKVESCSSKETPTLDSLAEPISKEVSVKNAETFEHTVTAKTKKPEPPRTLNIRKETDPSLSLIADNDDDDLFRSSSVKLKVEPALSEFNTLPKHSDISTAMASNKPVIPSKPGPPQENPSKSIASIISGISGSADVSEVDAAAVATKKFKHVSPLSGIHSSLKIDPFALLPGAKPPSKRLNKEASPEKDSDGKSPTSGNISSDTSKLTMDCESVTGFDQSISKSETLPSTLKDRAKLGSKRRPPSNKARREAARASQSFDDKSEAESPQSPDAVNTSSESGGDMKKPKSIFSPNSNILSPSTDEDDLFGVPQDLPPEYGKQHIPSTDIFGGAPILSPGASDQLFTNSSPDASGQLFTKSLSSHVPPIQPESTSQHLNIKSPQFSKRSEFDGSLFSSSSAQPENLKNEVANDSPSYFITSSQDKNATSVNYTHSGQSLFPSDAQNVEPESAVSAITDATSASLLNTDHGKKSSSLRNLPTVSAAVDVDPLFNSEHTASSDEGEMTEGLKVDSTDDDHSSLFPFVKKKSDLKDAPHRPLFSKAPSLPSKAEDYEPKLSDGNLDDESDLFSSSSTLLVNKSEDSLNILKTGGGKHWQLSDDEDDDLFLSGAQLSQKTSSNHNASVIGSSRNSPENKVFKNTTGAVTEESPGVKKTQSPSGNGLFGENDDNTDDLFSKPSVFSKKSKTASSLKTSLFDEDDDDLFGSPTITSQIVVKGHQSSGSSAIPRPSSIPSASTTKLKSETTFEDPLMALNRDV